MTREVFLYELLLTIIRVSHPDTKPEDIVNKFNVLSKLFKSKPEL